MTDVIAWNEDKNNWLREHRGLTFDMVKEAVVLGLILDDIPHPSPARSHQRMLVFKDGKRYVAVPYVQDGDCKFLKTMFVSRDLERIYGDSNGETNRQHD